MSPPCWHIMREQIQPHSRFTFLRLLQALGCVNLEQAHNQIQPGSRGSPWLGSPGRPYVATLVLRSSSTFRFFASWPPRT